MEQSNNTANAAESTIVTRKFFFEKRKGCPLKNMNSNEISYKNPDFLKKFTSEGGRILTARITGMCYSHQQILKKQIKIARMLALLPFIQKID